MLLVHDVSMDAGRMCAEMFFMLPVKSGSSI